MERRRQIDPRKYIAVSSLRFVFSSYIPDCGLEKLVTWKHLGALREKERKKKPSFQLKGVLVHRTQTIQDTVENHLSKNEDHLN